MFQIKNSMCCESITDKSKESLMADLYRFFFEIQATRQYVLCRKNCMTQRTCWRI